MSAHAAQSLRSKHAGGFSTVEALLCIVVTIVAIVALLAITPMSFTRTQSDAIAIQAVAAGQQYMDALRSYIQKNGNNANLPAPPSIAIDAGGVLEGSGEAAPANYGAFDMNTYTCTLKPNTMLLYDCTVTVKWIQAGAARSISVQSYATYQAST